MYKNAFDLYSIEELYDMTDLDIEDVDSDFFLKEENGYDYLNRNNSRNTSNTREDDYNCGGFALNTYNWYKPYEGSWEWREQLLLDWSSEYYDQNGNPITLIEEIVKDLENRLAVRDVLYMLRQFKGKLRRVNGREDLWKNERLIAYRVGIQYNYDENEECFRDFDIDFHFRWLNEERNCWVEKLGCGQIRDCFENEDEDVFPWVETFWTYTSDVIYLALQL